MKFNSQICTSREQSERLLALGLKKETADMCWQALDGEPITYPYAWMNGSIITNNHFPAWSLGRLIKDLMPQKIGHLDLAVGSDYAGYYEDGYDSEFGIYWEYVEETPDMFNNIISTIEWLIKEGYFNKEYLEE
jgi:hypothetical protein